MSAAPVLGLHLEAARAAFWKLLPSVYRGRDVHGELERCAELFSDELWRLRALLEQQQRDHFIASCQDWLVPYLGELVGASVLFKDASLNRQDVKNAIRWRRQKGTLAGLEGLASGVSGWGVHAVEMFERTLRFQHLTHVKLHAQCAPDLHEGAALAAQLTPFGAGAALLDLRPAHALHGHHRAGTVMLHEWPIRSYPLKHVMPAAVGGGRFFFHPSGRDTQLYASGDKALACPTNLGARRPDICHGHIDDTPIRIRDAREHPDVYVSSPFGFELREDGIALTSHDAAPIIPSTASEQSFAEFSKSRGMIAADASLFTAGQQFRLDAVRLGAVIQIINGAASPVAYSPSNPFATQLQLRSPHGELALDAQTPNFAYTPGAAPYTPDSDEFHHAALLLAITNVGPATAAFPDCEVILRNARGAALQVFLPAIAAVPVNQTIHVYVAKDGGTYFARGDHSPGPPDRNPDNGQFGAFLLPHLARGAEGQVRLRPGHAPAPNRFRRAVLRSLCCWDKPLNPPLAPGEIGFDPERGRFMFAAGEAPLGELTVDFRYGLLAECGAGPYERAAVPPAFITVARMRNADHASIQAAIDAAPNGAATPIVIEILDSATYYEALVVANRSFPGGLIIQAAALQTPFIRKPSAASDLWSIQNSTISALTLDGLALHGGRFKIDAGVGALHINHCSLEPGSVSLEWSNVAVDLHVLDSICGPMSIATSGGTAVINDSIVQHPSATIEQPHGNAALALANVVASIERSTLIGDFAAQSAYLSNDLLYGEVALIDVAASCVRFTRTPPGFATSRMFRATNATPIFISLRCGDAAYCCLHPNTSRALRAGGEDGGEIGVFYGAGLPWREQNVRLRIAEHIPAGLEPIQALVLPQRRWQGISRS